MSAALAFRSSAPTKVARDVVTFEAAPLEYFLRAGVSTLTLIRHGASALEELYTYPDRKIAICYRRNGKLVSERVTRLELLERTEALGWVPWGSGADERMGFHDAVFFFHASTKTHWFSAEGCFDEDTFAPLCLSHRQLSALRAAQVKRTEAWESLERQRRQDEIDQRSERVAQLLAARAVREGQYATVEEALPEVRQHWEDAKVATFGAGHGV